MTQNRRKNKLLYVVLWVSVRNLVSAQGIYHLLTPGWEHIVLWVNQNERTAIKEILFFNNSRNWKEDFPFRQNKEHLLRLQSLNVIKSVISSTVSPWFLHFHPRVLSAAPVSYAQPRLSTRIFITAAPLQRKVSRQRFSGAEPSRYVGVEHTTIEKYPAVWRETPSFLAKCNHGILFAEALHSGILLDIFFRTIIIMSSWEQSMNKYKVICLAERN